MTYRVAFQARNGCAKLYALELMELDPGSEVMRKLRAKAKEIMFPSRVFGLVWKVVIETAIIEPVSTILLPLDPKSRYSSCNSIH
jgi:hypothetical protein